MAKKCCLVSVFTPFEHAHCLIKELLAINISTTVIKNLALDVGDHLYRSKLKECKEQWSPDIHEEKTTEVLYMQADGAMVPTRVPKKIEYKENKLGVVFTSDDILNHTEDSGEKRTVIHNKRFVGSIGKGVDEFKAMLEVTAHQKGVARSKQVVFISDGAAWLSKFKKEYFPGAIHILDWYHAVDHLWHTAHALFGEENTRACKKWVEPLKTLLWKGKVEKVIERIEEEALSGKYKTATSLFELRGYFFDKKKMMRYDYFREKGYYIGSGVIESANKYIMADRLKRTGMRWNIKNANAMIWLRSKYFEDRWHEGWDNINLKPHQKEVA